MDALGRWVVLLGLVLVVVGGLIWAIGWLSGWRGLPGDILYRSGRVTVYVPIVTCIVLSIVLSLLWWLWQWLTHR